MTLRLGPAFKLAWPERPDRDVLREMTDEAMDQLAQLLPPQMRGDYADADPGQHRWLECCLKLELELEAGTGNWKLETGSWKREAGNWKLEVERRCIKARSVWGDSAPGPGLYPAGVTRRRFPTARWVLTDWILNSCHPERVSDARHGAADDQ